MKHKHIMDKIETTQLKITFGMECYKGRAKPLG